MPARTPVKTSAVMRLKRGLTPCRSVLILTHDYPDPDAMASALGMKTLLHFWGVKTATIAYSGYIGRAENRAMIALLSIPMVPFKKIDVREFDRIVLVDCSPGAGNVSLTPEVSVDAVIDHHPGPVPVHGSCFAHLRTRATATSALIANLLIDAGCPISPILSTAFYYGIKTDTKDLPSRLSPSETVLRKRLLDTLDYRLIWSIENPQRDTEYFRCFNKGLDNLQLFGRIGLTILGSIDSPEQVAEIADFLSPLDALDWIACAGTVGENVFFSIRSRRSFQAGERAECLAQALKGKGGGHAHSAAGRIPFKGKSSEQMLRAFKKGFVHCFSLTGIKGSRFIQ